MPTSLIEYEYRVHDGTTALATFYAGSGGALLVASSVAGGTNPWLTEPPAGDGTTIDPLTGKTRAGAWSVSIGDPITSGTDRLVTSVLEDATRGWRSRLTSRRAFVRERIDGGAWVTSWVGFVARVRYSTAATVQIGHTDSPARDKDAAAATQRPTETVAAYVTRWPTRACLAGGPIRGGWLFRQDPGGWDVLVESQSGGFTVLRVTSAYAAPSFQRRTVNMFAPIQTLNDAARGYFFGSALLGGSFPRLTVETFTPGGASTFSEPVVLASPIYVPSVPSGPGPVLGGTPQYYDPTLFCSQERITVAGTVGSVGQVRRLRVLALDPSEAFPVYTTAHPVTLVETLLVEQGLTVDATSRDAVRDLVGQSARVSVRIASVRNFWRFAEELLAPYGVALRAIADGSVGFVAIRRTTSSLPSITITQADIAETDGAGIYEVEEQSVVARVAFSSVLYGLASPSDQSGPPDGVVAQPIRVEREAWDLGSEEAPRTLTIEADAMFHVDGQLESDAPRLGTAIAQDAFLRSRGGTVQIGELLVRRGTTPAALRVGDECLVNLPHLPHRNKRMGDDGSVPARVATVVRAQVEPEWVRLQLADAGSAAIDSGTAPTATVAQDATFPRQCVALTITNAATLNTAGRGVRVQVAVTSGAAPASTAYTDLVAYAPGAVPTTAERLGPFTPGQTVYLRLRAEQAGLRPGAWQTAISAALASLPAPSGVTATWGGPPNRCDITWTNGDAAALVVVAVRRTADPAPGRTIDVLPAGSNRLRVHREADADVFAAFGTGYTVEVWHLDQLTGQASARATATVTPSDTGTLAVDAPAVEVISPSGNPTAGAPTGIELSIATGATGEPMTVWRGTTSTRASATRIAILDPDTTTFRDYLPADNITRHYWVEYLRVNVNLLSFLQGYAGSAIPGPLRDQAGTADSPRPTVSMVGGQVYRQTPAAFASATPGGSVGGSGTPNRLARWATGSTLGNAVLADDGTHLYPASDATSDVGLVGNRPRDIRASRDVIAGGSFLGVGPRPLTMNSVEGSYRARGDAGGWAIGLFFNDSADTDRGGFGALGSAASLAYYFVGPSYLAPRQAWHASGGISLGDGVDEGASNVRVAGRLLVRGPEILVDNASGRITLVPEAGANWLYSTTTGFGAWRQMRFSAHSTTIPQITLHTSAGISLLDDTDPGAGVVRVGGHLRFPDATHDIGLSGANRPRDGFFSRDVMAGGAITSVSGTGVTGLFGSLRGLGNGGAFPTFAGNGEGTAYAASGLGLVLGGRGSLNDVTIVNRSGSGVLEVPTGTINVHLLGALRFNGATSGTVGDINIRRDATSAALYFGDGGNRYLFGSGGTLELGSSFATVTSLGNADIGQPGARMRDGWFSRDVRAGTFFGSGAGLTGIPFDALTVAGGSARDVLQISGGAPTWAALPLFSATLLGAVPASGGGTTAFLRADGAWAAPSVASVAADSVLGGTFSAASYVFSNAVRFASGLRLPDDEYIYRWDGSSAIAGLRYSTSLARWESAARWSPASLGTGTADATTFLRGDGTWQVPPAAPWTAVVKTADESRASTTTTTDDPDLAFAMAANTRYLVRGRLWVTNVGAAQDFAWRHAGPASPTLVRVHRAARSGASVTAGGIDTAYSGANIAVAGTAEEYFVEFDAIIHNGSTAGNFRVQWAQGASGATATTLRRGSYLEYRAI